MNTLNFIDIIKYILPKYLNNKDLYSLARSSKQFSFLLNKIKFNYQYNNDFKLFKMIKYLTVDYQIFDNK